MIRLLPSASLGQEHGTHPTDAFRAPWIRSFVAPAVDIPACIPVYVLLASLLLACEDRDTDAWLASVPEFVCRRDAAPADAAPRGRRALEIKPDSLPLTEIPRVCPDLLGGPGPTSVGSVVDGYLCGAGRLEVGDDLPYVLLEATRDRGTFCGAPLVLEALEAGAQAVAERHPGLRLPIGNVARCGGGDIPWSVSHNSGRDADVYFYMTWSAVAPRTGRAGEEIQYLPYKASPIALDDLSAPGVGPKAWFATGARAQFDADANLDFLLALVTRGRPRLQWVFVARPIRDAVLKRARQRKIDAATLKRLASILHQPRRALPHDDHFHLRFACTKSERARGCVDRAPLRGSGRVGPPRPGDPLVRELLARTNRPAEAASASDKQGRVDALRVLWALGVRGVGAKIQRAWDALDDRGRVLALAIMAREPLPRRARRALYADIASERSASVLRYAISYLFTRLGDPGVEDALVELARAPRSFDRAGRPFETYRSDCLVLRGLGVRGSLPLLERLLQLQPAPCPGDEGALDQAIEWLTAWPAASFHASTGSLLREGLIEVKRRGLTERGYVLGAEPPGSPAALDALLNAASALDPVAAFNACYLLLAEGHEDRSVCLWNRDDRLWYLRRLVSRRSQ